MDWGIDGAFRRRTMIAGAMVLAALAVYSIALHYSPRLVQYAVEQTLIQKSPEGVEAPEIRQRLQAVLESLPDERSRLDRLLEISQKLEKNSRLNAAQLGELLGDALSRRSSPKKL